MKTVLVVGGYGSVGRIIVEILSKTDNLRIIIAGRNREKAAGLARLLKVGWVYIDLNIPDSIKDALEGIDIVLNCFVGLENNNLDLQNKCIQRHCDYIDMAAIPEAYHREFMALKGTAALGGSTLITALGLNPGIPGLLLISNKDIFDEIEGVDIYFTMGAKIDMSILSLQGMAEMMNTRPMEWENGKWQKPSKSFTRHFIEKPYRRTVFFGPSMVTSDLLPIPSRINAKRITFWSGFESLDIFIRLYAGIKLGRAANEQKALKLLKSLKKSGAAYSSDCNLTIIVKGKKNERALMRTTTLIATEEFLTAIAPSIACMQLADGLINRKGTFFPPDIINPESFIAHLKEIGTNYEDKLTYIS